MHFFFTDDVLSEIFCATLIFIGLFICFFGHRFFKTEMFLVGMFTGVIITYILISIISQNISESGECDSFYMYVINIIYLILVVLFVI